MTKGAAAITGNIQKDSVRVHKKKKKKKVTDVLFIWPVSLGLLYILSGHFRTQKQFTKLLSRVESMMQARSDMVRGRVAAVPA